MAAAMCSRSTPRASRRRSIRSAPARSRRFSERQASSRARWRRTSGSSRSGKLGDGLRVALAVGLPLDRLDEILVEPQRLVDLRLDLLGHLEMLVQVGLRVVAPLSEPLVAVGEERARLRDDIVLDREIQDAARRRDAGAELDVELRLAERR